jgi:A/G-specific adenine glycosylase
MLDPKTKTELRRRLRNWFDSHQRDLPWRTDKTPYRIWVSEIMLQQTQVATVIDYFQRFVTRFPDVSSLASAEEAEILKLWEGLGYYRRARQMHAAAKLICEKHDAKFPLDFDQVLALPGVGRYTAGAILSISTDQRLPILEGNTIRLFARLMGLKTDPKTSANQARLWEFSESLLPSKLVGDFNQALMELGSEICTPRNPDCPHCPLLKFCPTFAGGWQS